MHLIRLGRSCIAREFVLGQRGKGMAVWMGLGYIILLAYPIAKLKYAFTKGYYARFGDRLFGRVVRLF